MTHPIPVTRSGRRTDAAATPRVVIAHRLFHPIPVTVPVDDIAQTITAWYPQPTDTGWMTPEHHRGIEDAALDLQAALQLGARPGDVHEPLQRLRVILSWVHPGDDDTDARDWVRDRIGPVFPAHRPEDLR